MLYSIVLHSELQLAALLGKTLLEQNGVLELKLTTLQDFAEDTLTAKKVLVVCIHCKMFMYMFAYSHLLQTLSRRLSETQNSLSLSHRSCEQLELKVEELEKTNNALLKLCDGRQHTLEQTNSTVYELEDKIEKLEQENLLLRTQTCNESRKLNGESLPITVEIEAKSVPSPQLQTVVDELTERSHKMAAQKQALEQEVKHLNAENHTLRSALEQMELAMTEMQEKCAVIVEEDTQSSDVAASPKTPATNMFSPTTFEDQLLTTPVKKSFKIPKATEKQGESLFSEIDQQYSTLLQQYEDLLHSCTCSASLSHLKNATVRALVTSPTTARDAGSTDRPFQELFDDMFAALRQTAQVADRLIVRKKEG